MSDDDPTLAEVAARGQPIDGNRLLVNRHPWNVVMPRPPELPSPAKPRYRLTMQHNSECVTGTDRPVSAQAECDDMDRLLELNWQFTMLDYRFMKLELISPGE